MNFLKGLLQLVAIFLICSVSVYLILDWEGLVTCYEITTLIIVLIVVLLISGGDRHKKDFY